MKTESTGAYRQLNRLFRTGTAGGLTDSQLLDQFVSGDNDSAALAFEAIVKRHGSMVLQVCRMVLQDEHAAEDAFQATFLVLARKARRLGTSELLGNWLYGVATRTARKAKAIAARRRVRDRQATAWRAVAVKETPHDQSRADIERVLHEEIDRLPHPYRAAIVVCYLEGLSQAQAAHHLRVAESTVRGRLARARKLLGQRLTRRGVAPSMGLVAVSKSVDGSWRLPGTIAQATAQAALFFVNRIEAMPGAVSATASDIANGVLSTMWFNSLKMIAIPAIVLGLLGAGTSLVAQRATAVRPQLEQARRDADADRENMAMSLASEESAQARRSNPVQGPVKGHQPATVDSDLVRVAPGPIVRAIPVFKDCMVLAYLPDWNFGNVDNIGIGNNDGGVRTLIDWPAIAPDEVSAPDRQFLLALYSRKTISHPPASVIHSFEVLSEWPERTSWKTQPRYDADPAASYKFQPGDGWKLFDVTPLVRARAQAGRKGHGILLRFLTEDVTGGPQEMFSDYKMVSREGANQWAHRRPLLLVVKASKPTRPLGK